jgi:Tfp pilus assembly protein PilE
MRALKIRATGVSLIELMLVIAILTIIVLMSTRYFYVTRNAQRVNETTEMIKNIVAASERWLATNNDYTGLTLQTLVDHDYLPKSFDVSNNPTNAWGGTIAVTGTSNTLTIILNNLESKSCVGLASNLATESCIQATPPTAFCSPIGGLANYTITLTIPQTCFMPSLAPH